MLQRFTTARHSLNVLTKIVQFIRNPTNDRVFAVADALLTRSPDFLRVRDPEFFDHPRVAAALARRPRIGAVDMAALAALPEGTLGRCFADHMTAHKLNLADIPTLEVTQPDQYIRAHLYETHDIWHVLTAMDADGAGELGVQAFYLAQVPAPVVTALIGGGLFNTAFVNFSDMPGRMRAILRGFLLGRRAEPLFGVPWHEWWSRPLAEVRRELGIDLAAVDAFVDGRRVAELAELRQ
jgi:ubiquinone biosynthesis protein COQ4